MTFGFYFFCFFIYVSIFVISDKMLGDTVKGKYYLIHFINNMFITFYTYRNILECLTDIYKFQEYTTNPQTIIITFALHVYHIISYFDKLRFDDWLHHILMIAIVVPVGIFMNSGSLLGCGLFFLSGLPGGIDYLLLFLVRNKIIDRMLEKYINTYLNIWIRCPGCIFHATISTLTLIKFADNYSYFNLISGFLCVFIIFWNGVYFMNQVVQNYAVNNYILNQKKN